MEEVIRVEKRLWQKFQGNIKSYDEAQELMAHLEEYHHRESIGSKVYCSDCGRYEIKVWIALSWWQAYKYPLWLLVRLFSSDWKYF